MLEIPQGAGSGLIWDMTGHIVTNYHVIRGASELQVLSSATSSVVPHVSCAVDLQRNTEHGLTDLLLAHHARC